MQRSANHSGTSVLRLLAVLLLLASPQIGRAAGTWSIISLPLEPGDVGYPMAVAVDAAGNLYVAEAYVADYGRFQELDAQGNWSVITSPGQVRTPTAIAVDALLTASENFHELLVLKCELMPLVCASWNKPCVPVLFPPSAQTQGALLAL